MSRMLNTTHDEAVKFVVAQYGHSDAGGKHTILAYINGHRVSDSETTWIHNHQTTDADTDLHDRMEPLNRLDVDLGLEMEETDSDSGSELDQTDTDSCTATLLDSNVPADRQALHMMLCDPYTFPRDSTDNEPPAHDQPGAKYTLTEHQLHKHSPAGEYTLTSTHIHKHTQHIWVRMLHNENGKTYSGRWAAIKRYTSRTVPAAIDPDTCLCPDILVIEGIPQGAPIPTRPTDTVTLRIIDAAYSLEGPDRFSLKHQNKVELYTHLLQKWKRMGWGIDEAVEENTQASTARVRTILIGHRGGIPNHTLSELVEIGIEKARAVSTCKKLSQMTLNRLVKILSFRRRLERTDERIRARSAAGKQIWKKDRTQHSPAQHDPG